MDNREGKSFSSNGCLAAIAAARQQSRQSRYHTSLQLGLSSCLPVSDLKSQAFYRHNAAQRRWKRAVDFWTMCCASPASAIANATAVTIPTSAINTSAAVADANIAQTSLTATSVLTTSTAINSAAQRSTADPEAPFLQEQAPLKHIATTVAGADSDEAHRIGHMQLRRIIYEILRQRQLGVNVGDAYDSGPSSTGSSSGSSSSGLTNFTDMDAAMVAAVLEPDTGGGSVLFDPSDLEPGCEWPPYESLSRLSTTCTATHTSSSRRSSSSFSGSGRDVDAFGVYCTEEVSGNGFSGGLGYYPLAKTSSCPSPLAFTSSHPFDGGFHADSFAHHEVSEWMQLLKDVRQLHDLGDKELQALIEYNKASNILRQIIKIAADSIAAGNTAAKGCSAQVSACAACDRFTLQREKWMEAQKERIAMVDIVAAAAMGFPVYGIACRLEAAARCGVGSVLARPAVESFDVQDPASGLPGRAVLLMRCLLLVADRGQSPTQPHLHPQHNNSSRASSSNPKHARVPLSGSRHVDQRLEMACLRPSVGGLMALTWALLAHHGIRTPLLYHEYELLWNMLAELQSSYMTTGLPTAPQLTYHAHLTTIGNLLAIVRSYTAAATSHSDTLSTLRKLSREDRITAFRSLVKEHVRGVGEMWKEDLGRKAAVAEGPLRDGGGGGGHKSRTSRPAAGAGRSTGGGSGGGGDMGSAGAAHQNEREGILRQFKGWSEGWVKAAIEVGRLKAIRAALWPMAGGVGAGGVAEAHQDAMRSNLIVLLEQWQKVVCNESPEGGGGAAGGGSARGAAGSRDGKQEPIVLRKLKTEAAARAELARELLALEYGERPRNLQTVGTAPMLLVLRTAAVLSELRAAASPASMRAPRAPPAAMSEPRLAGALSLEGSTDLCGPIGIQLITRRKLQVTHESKMHRSGAPGRRPCVVEMQLVTCPLTLRTVLAAAVEAAVGMTTMTAPGTRVGAGCASELIRVSDPGDSWPHDASRKLTPHQLRLHQDVAAALRSRRLAVVQPDSEAALESALVMLARWRLELPLAPGRSILVVPFIPDLAAHVSMRDPVRQLKQMVGMADGGGALGVSGGLASSDDGTPDQDQDPRSTPPTPPPQLLRPDWPLRRRLGLTCLLSRFLGWADGTGGDRGGDPKPCPWDCLGYQRLAAAAQQRSTSSSCEVLPLPLLVVLDCAVGGGELGVLERS